MSGHVRFFYVTINIELKTQVERKFSINVNKGLMNAEIKLLLPCGSFLKGVVPCGRRGRAAVEFFGEKRVSAPGIWPVFSVVNIGSNDGQ